MLHGWLDRRGVTDFDPETFGISTSEAVFVKPQQRLVLELAMEALQDAGLPPSTLLGKRVGVFVAANGQEGYDKLLLDEADSGVHTLGAHYGHGTHNASLAGRVAHWLGSCGPAMTIETACSGGLTAVHAAQRSLKAGDCDVALVAGVTTFVDPERQFPFRRQAGMATRLPEQQSRAFSSSADGMVPSEGAVAVVLQAQHGGNTGARHGEPLAWIESIECEHQGASATMMTTRSDAQSRLIHHALAAAEVEPQAIDVFECHGSATQLGDLVEFGAIRRVFGGSVAKRAAPVAITASKNIFGHTEEAAGLVGLLHAIVSLRHRSSPPSHVSDPNIDFDWAGAGARYSNCRTSLGRGQNSPMHALVSSYGFSGTMCSAVLRIGQEHPQPQPQPHQERDERLANLLLLSAPDRTRLRLVGKACVEHLRNAP
ncbi:ketoacyl-synt-domain-containing protein, partial [Acaromyces ingoldii]